VRRFKNRGILNPTIMEIAVTQRLILRHFRTSDAEAMDRVLGDAYVMRFGDGVQAPDRVRFWIRREITDRYRTWGFGKWAVVEKASGDVIGYCGLAKFNDRVLPGEVEIGYRLARSHWGKGYATEAARAVVSCAFDTLELPRVIAVIDPENVASLRVAEKLGMRYVRDVIMEGWTHPDRVYAIDRTSEKLAFTGGD
jgi:RimJ/RimL family protein N-acetyltransferase